MAKTQELIVITPHLRGVVAYSGADRNPLAPLWEKLVQQASLGT